MRSLGALTLVMVAYWSAWFSDRSLVASDHGAVYFGFENAFPLADGLLSVALIATIVALKQRRPSALLFGLMGAGAGLYLFAMDVLYDLEHGIWTRGANGVVELAINVITVTASLVLARWLWTHREQLSNVDAS